jgi:hypothetical protein
MESPNNLDATVFVYRKDDLIRCHYLEDARYFEESPLWDHIATLEPRRYIESLLNDNKALLKALMA